jgi:hypothetical protein
MSKEKEQTKEREPQEEIRGKPIDQITDEELARMEDEEERFRFWLAYEDGRE